VIFYIYVCKLSKVRWFSPVAVPPSLGAATVTYILSY